MNSLPCEIDDKQLIELMGSKLKELGVSLETEETDKRKQLYIGINNLHVYVKQLIDRIKQQEEKIKMLNNIIETKNENYKKFISEKESIINLNNKLIQREALLMKELNEKNNVICAQANLIKEAMDKKLIKKVPMNITSTLSPKITMDEDPKSIFYKQSIEEHINKVHTLEKEKNEIIEYMKCIKNEIYDIIIKVAPNKELKESNDINIENKLQREIRKGISILKQWCIEQYKKDEYVIEYVGNLANIVELYKTYNNGLANILKEIVRIPEENLKKMLLNPNKIDEMIMKNIDYDNKEMISNISLHTLNYYSNREFYLTIKKDIHQTTLILNEYQTLINNHKLFSSN